MDPKTKKIKGWFEGDNAGHVETGGQKQIVANYTNKELALLFSG